MTYLLLQLDDLSTLDVCMVLDQESAYAKFFCSSSHQSSCSHSVDYEERLTERITMRLREELMRQFGSYGIRSAVDPPQN